MMQTLVVALGGALGAISRYWFALAAAGISRNLPWGTILINIIGSFIIGFFGSLTVAHGRLPASENLRLFVLVGVCGGFTTFSSFSLQTLDLLRGGAVGRACLNIGISVMFCLLAVAAGYQSGHKLSGAAMHQVAQAAVEEDAS
jgi:fluoride exporter